MIELELKGKGRHHSGVFIRDVKHLDSGDK